MHKTSVYLAAEETARLAALAEREGTSQAEVIRRAIRLYEPERKGDRDFALIGAADDLGSPRSSIADVPDDELLQGFGE